MGGKIKHGDVQGGARPRLYRIWMGMRKRCFASDKSRYQRYAGRGIGICQEWSQYSDFKAWALANGYTDDLCIDRIDNDGDYCADNCKWVTRAENNGHTSKTKMLTVDGITLCATAWAKRLGRGKNYVWNWILRHGEAEAERRLGNLLAKDGD